MNGSTNPLLDKEEHVLKLGESFEKKPKSSFHTIRCECEKGAWGCECCLTHTEITCFLLQEKKTTERLRYFNKVLIYNTGISLQKQCKLNCRMLSIRTFFFFYSLMCS